MTRTEDFVAVTVEEVAKEIKTGRTEEEASTISSHTHNRISNATSLRCSNQCQDSLYPNSRCKPQT